MKIVFVITLMLVSQFVFGQKTDTDDIDPIKYIQDYYSNFSTGYDFDGRYITLSENYKVVFTDSTFTLTFYQADENETLQKCILTFYLKDVTSITSDGAKMIEVFGDETYAIPICGKLEIKTTNESYEINIYYEKDKDVKQSEIYKAFEIVLTSN